MKTKKCQVCGRDLSDDNCECVCPSRFCHAELYRCMDIADKQIASMSRGSFDGRINEN